MGQTTRLQLLTTHSRPPRDPDSRSTWHRARPSVAAQRRHESAPFLLTIWRQLLTGHPRGAVRSSGGALCPAILDPPRRVGAGRGRCSSDDGAGVGDEELPVDEVRVGDEKTLPPVSEDGVPAKGQPSKSTSCRETCPMERFSKFAPTPFSKLTYQR